MEDNSSINELAEELFHITSLESSTILLAKVKRLIYSYPVAYLARQKLLSKWMKISFVLCNAHRNMNIWIHTRWKWKVICSIYNVNAMWIIPLPPNILLKSSCRSSPAVNLERHAKVRQPTNRSIPRQRKIQNWSYIYNYNYEHLTVVASHS